MCIYIVQQMSRKVNDMILTANTTQRSGGYIVQPTSGKFN